MMDNLLLNFHIKHIHRRARKLPGTNTHLKQQIQLRERSSSRFRQAEVNINDAEEAWAAPEEACIVAPVPRGGVEHVWGKHATDYTDDVAGFC